MSERLRQGSTIPEFCYDSPYQGGKSFYRLLDEDRPAVLVFLRNFGHPLSRHYITEYIKSIGELKDARLVCVVQTKPQVIAEAVPEGSLPFELMCDAESVLYGFLGVPQEKRWYKSYSLKAMKILNEAKKQGYVDKRDEPQQLPLTTVVGREGRVLFAHYGESMTDLPEDCGAMQRVIDQLKAIHPLGMDAHEPEPEEKKESTAPAQEPMPEPVQPEEVQPEAGEAPQEKEVPQEPVQRPQEDWSQSFEVVPLDLDEPEQPEQTPECSAFEAEVRREREDEASGILKRLDLAMLGFGPDAK